MKTPAQWLEQYTEFRAPAERIIAEIQRDAREGMVDGPSYAEMCAKLREAQILLFNVVKDRDAFALDLRAKLDAAERACAAYRAALEPLEACWPMGTEHWNKKVWPLLKSPADAGDYVPRSEVDAAWRKGMTDAIEICGDHCGCRVNIKFCRDKRSAP